uniref:Uncharacterized protein n=1 Tax=Rhizophora mucronata TaxID=61149 RepID=A0A2P2QC05_RHIMU
MAEVCLKRQSMSAKKILRKWLAHILDISKTMCLARQEV